MKTVYVVDGCRSPFLKFRRKPGPFKPTDLAVATARPLLLRQPFNPNDLDEVIIGCVIQLPDEMNLARIVSYRLGCTDNVPAWTVQRNCGSGLQAIDSAYRNIKNGDANLILAGGVDSMSHAPLLIEQHMVNWLAKFMTTRSVWSKIKSIRNVRPHHFIPTPALLKGLTDPLIGLSMGQTAELLAYDYSITREMMDNYSVESHQRLAYAQKHGIFDDEIVTIYDREGKVYTNDEGVRPSITTSKLATMKPAFDHPFGNVTAGNSSQISDGAGFLLLASEEAVEQHNLSVLGIIEDIKWTALSPERMGLGPVYATIPLMSANKITTKDIDYWEINEAFAAQVLACLNVFENYGMKGIEHSQLNINGGGISLGHPVSASGVRIVLHLLKTLQHHQKKRGIASLCIGGGQGGAALLKRLEQ